MSEKLQQAITSIKAGNKQLGQQLLAQVLQEEPGNEVGWLWMSAVVSEDKRKYCIERVLQINPNNQHAGQALEKLKQIEETSQQPSILSSVTPKPSQQSVSPKSESDVGISPAKPDPQAIRPKLWINQGSKQSHIMVLLDDKLIAAKCDAGLTLQVQIKLTQGDLPAELLTELSVVPYKNILAVDESVGSIRIEFKGKNNQKEKVRFEYKDKEMGKTIMRELGEWLKSDFISTITPMRRGEILLGNGVLASIILIITAFVSFVAKTFQTNGLILAGRGLIGLIAFLLSLIFNWIGPGGIACIGGGILLIVLAIMVNSLINPPLVTTFSRRTSKKL